MKKPWLILASLVTLIFIFSLSFSQYGQKENQPDPKAELAKSIEGGKALFNDKSLGTSGQTCNTCHPNGGNFDDLGCKYPKYWGMAKKVMTLSQVVNWCIVNPLKGKALAWDDQKLTDLTAYCASVKPSKK